MSGSTAADTIDLTRDDDDDRQAKRPRQDAGPSLPQPSARPAYPAATYAPQTPYAAPTPAASPYPQPTNGYAAQPYGVSSPYGASAYAQQPPSHPYTPPPPPGSYFPAAAPGANPAYIPPRPAYQQPPYAPAAAARPPPPGRAVIDLTGSAPSTPPPGALPPPKDMRKDVVCIGELNSTALVLYPIPYVCLSNGPSHLPADYDYVPVRLRHESGPSLGDKQSDDKKRARGQNNSSEENIQISSPHYKSPEGEDVGGEDFGVVEQRTAAVLGPLMARVLIRLEATVKRSAKSEAILPLRLLVFTPRGNIRVVSEFLRGGGCNLAHPAIPYNPINHRDHPEYMNPHLPLPGMENAGLPKPNYGYGAGGSKYARAVEGKSVEVQRSQVDELFKSLRSGEELTETEPGPNVATNLYPHQKKALTFLLEREKEKAIPNKSGWIWQARKDAQGRIKSWFNPVTGKEVTKEPPESKGGILADDMGLGKTISVVSLMAKTMDSARVFAYGPIQKITLRVPKSAPEAPLTAAAFAAQVWGMPEAANDAFALDETSASSLYGTSGYSFGKGKKGKGKRETMRELEQTAREARIKVKSRATLIVCPLSTISNWEDQFREHWSGEVIVVGGAAPTPATNNGMNCTTKKPKDTRPRTGLTLRLYIYHGAARRPDTSYLADFDAVITTYSTLATEYSKQVKSTELYEHDGTGPNESESDSGSESFSDTDQNGQAVVRLKDKKKKPKKRPPGAALAAGLEISSALQQVHWFRVVLDEAHSIKETTTIASRACCDLMADRRLALTGTPVQNKLDDVYALIKFLRFNPFDDKSTWSEFIGGPAKFGQPLGVARLQTIMKSITLRRTKETKDATGKTILDLPPRHDEVRYLKFDETEQAVYDSYYTESKAEFTTLRKNGEVMKNYVGILQKILRLRQICDHYELVKGKDEILQTAEFSMNFNEIVAQIERDGLTIGAATAVFALLREAGTAQCVECGMDLATPNGADALLDGTEIDTPAASSSTIKKGGRKSMLKGGPSRGPTRVSSPTGIRPVLTRCQHLYCIECFRLSISPAWPKVRDETTHPCSACQTVLNPTSDAMEVSPDGLIPNEGPKPRPPKKERRQKGSGLMGYNASTKVRALMGDLMDLSTKNPYSANYDPRVVNELLMVDAQGNIIDEGVTKTIVFSQWTSMLDKIEDALEEANIGYDRLDGTMKRDDRTRAMDALKYDPKTEVLLVSLRAGGVGLNLTAARRVYLMDPYWNPAVENQAVDRIHRLGQKHPVQTIKMIMEDSIETRLLEVQARKTQLANMTLGQPISKAEMMQRRMEELSELFAK